MNFIIPTFILQTLCVCVSVDDAFLFVGIPSLIKFS